MTISESVPTMRAVLFVPADNPRALKKAAGLGADALIFDLEDAVGPAGRGAAEVALRAHLAGEARQAPCVLIRVASDTSLEGWPEDRIDGVVIPKVDGPEDLAETSMPVWAMIETAKGVVNLEAIARANIVGLIAGPNDLRRSLGTQALPGRADIATALSLIVLHARANGLVALDGVYNALHDEAGFAADCAQGRALGFHGKTLIHPSQIAPALAAFGPTYADIARAQAIIAAFEAAPGSGVLSVNGEMVERLHLEAAREVMAGAMLAQRPGD